jgi:phosphatidylinositol alpha 1,6-mannosyltransferase
MREPERSVYGMRVLYCTDTWLPQVNGVTVVTEVSARGVAERGWEVEVIAPRYPAADLIALSKVFGSSAAIPRVHSIPSLPAPRYPELRIALPDAIGIARKIRRFAPDLVHCATEFVIGRLGMWAADRLGIPVVTSYHTNFRQYAEIYGLGRVASAIERHIAAMHANAWRTYTPSVDARNELWRLGVREVEVWGRGVDTGAFTPERRSGALRTRLGLQSAFTFLYVGRLAQEKSVDVVLRAFARLTAKLGHDSVRLVVAGSGPDEPRLREMAPRGTTFLGNLDRSRELPELYATADAFVFASTTETLGLVVLEAMASGLPVIATPVGGVAEHLRDNVNGLSFQQGNVEALADTMHRLAATPWLREELSEGALRTAQALSWDAELDRLDASYRAVCEEARSVRDLPLKLGLRKA